MRAILTIFLFAAGPVLAGCPTSADLRAGVTLVQNAPFFQRADVELQASGFQEARVFGAVDGPKTVEIRTFDHALAPRLIQSGQSRTRIDYDAPVAGLERLRETGEARLSAIVQTDTGVSDQDELLFVLKETGETQILSCRYETWSVEEMRARGDGSVTTRQVTYAPSLGLVLAVDSGDPRTSFAYSWIGTAADVAR